jgi:hypothetical protein
MQVITLIGSHIAIRVVAICHRSGAAGRENIVKWRRADCLVKARQAVAGVSIGQIINKRPRGSALQGFDVAVAVIRDAELVVVIVR